MMEKMKGRLYLRSYAHADNKSFGDLSITILKCFDFNVYKQANVNIASIPWVGRAITAKTMTIVISGFSRTIHIPDYIPGFSKTTCSIRCHLV